MIYPYDNASQTRWDRGEFKVQLNQPNNQRPLGFCDGSPEDVAELLSIVEGRGRRRRENPQEAPQERARGLDPG